jgi:CPA1 family monovalent cation:H+ antiporter
LGIFWCLGCCSCCCSWDQYFGHFGLSRNTSASSRITLLSFWEYASFTANTFIFLLIEVEINLVTPWKTVPAILLAVLAYQIGRILTVYPLLATVRWFDIPLRWQHLLFLGNIKVRFQWL